MDVYFVMNFLVFIVFRLDTLVLIAVISCAVWSVDHKVVINWS